MLELSEARVWISQSFYYGLFLNSTRAILTNLLSLRLVRAVGARINVGSPHAQWSPILTWIQTQVLTIANPLLLLVPVW